MELLGKSHGITSVLIIGIQSEVATVAMVLEKDRSEHAGRLVITGEGSKVRHWVRTEPPPLLVLGPWT